MQTVFLTGITGFIGAHIARQLHSDGIAVAALIRPQSDRWRIADIANDIQFIEGDLRFIDRYADALRQIKPDVCIHAGWVATGDYLTTAENVKLLSGSLALLELLPQVGCEHFIGVGTCIEYDTSYGYLHESTPLAPKTLYAASKASLALMSQAMPIPATWLRLFQPFGIYESRTRLIPQVITHLLQERTIDTTSGEQVRDFINAIDIAEAVLAVAKSQKSGVFNVGSGQPRTLRDVILFIGELLDRRELIKLGARVQRAGEPPFICANIARIQEEIGWQPRISINDGIISCVEWWKHYLQKGVRA